MTEYIQCRICMYWILKRVKNCPNCGIKYPYKEKKSLFKIILPVFILFGHIFFYFIVELFTKYNVLLSYFFISFGGISFFSVFSGFLIDARLKKKRHRSKKCLIRNEENINNRIKDIEERIVKIKQIKKRLVNQDKTGHTSSLIKILDDTGAFFNTYLIKYSGELWKIELIRWKNIIEPIEFNWEKNNYENLEKCLETLKNTRKIGVRLEKKWAKDPYADTRNGIMLLGNLRELIKGCEKFYKVILARQARLLIMDVSPINDRIDEFRTIKGGGGYPELFNAKRDLLTFFSSFEELEKEFDRLEAEKELMLE